MILLAKKKNKKDWNHAVNIVKDNTDKPKSKFKDMDWGLTMHIYKNIEKSKKNKKKKAKAAVDLAKLAGFLDNCGEFDKAEEVDLILKYLTE